MRACSPLGHPDTWLSHEHTPPSSRLHRARGTIFYGATRTCYYLHAQQVVTLNLAAFSLTQTRTSKLATLVRQRLSRARRRRLSAARPTTLLWKYCPTPLGKVIDCSPTYVKEALEKSLEKLGVDYIDLYYAHRADPTVPIEHTVGALAELVKEGKIKYIGICECNGETLRRANKVHPISAIQVEYSPFTLDAEDPKIGALQAARELGVTVFAYSPLGRGLLTGKYTSPDDFEEDDLRRIIPRYSKENFPNVLKVVEEIKQIGGPDIIPIPGTRNVKYLNENLGSLNVKLSPEEVQEVRNIAERADSVLGYRYPAGWLETVYANTPPL
ncbi:NADP-dependent oxidoreductase domain-containing protein [Lactarius vividus]|nr:NADP-dependent oxidoreductase domain-containing protein [Lactarius vividus]